MTAFVILFKHQQYCSSVPKLRFYAHLCFYCSNGSCWLSWKLRWCCCLRFLITVGFPVLDHTSLCCIASLHADMHDVVCSEIWLFWCGPHLYLIHWLFRTVDSWWCYTDSPNFACTVRFLVLSFLFCTSTFNQQQLKVNFSCRLLLCCVLIV